MNAIFLVWLLAEQVFLGGCSIGYKNTLRMAPSACQLQSPCKDCGYSYFLHPFDNSQFGICYRGRFFGYSHCSNGAIFSEVWKVCVFPKPPPPPTTTLDTGNSPWRRNMETDICGIAAKSLVVGGRESVPGEWPWNVSVMEGSRHTCGGTLLNSEWVITAAHCVYGKMPNQLQIALGVTELYRNAPSVRFRRVKNIVVHPYYIQGGSYPNDTALLKLSVPVRRTDYIEAVCLPFSTDKFTNHDQCWITGWGDTRGTGNPNVLNKLRVRITGLLECQRNWKSYVHTNHICVGDGYTGPCRGDSGGPLVCLRRGQYVLAGVASFGNELCHVHGFPAIYSKVSDFLNWIMYVMKTV